MDRLQRRVTELPERLDQMSQLTPWAPAVAAAVLDEWLLSRCENVSEVGALRRNAKVGE
jgi:hypothetical protein